MTPEEIARKIVKVDCRKNEDGTLLVQESTLLIADIAYAIREEREACAKLVESFMYFIDKAEQFEYASNMIESIKDIATAVRARD